MISNLWKNIKPHSRKERRDPQSFANFAPLR